MCSNKKVQKLFWKDEKAHKRMKKSKKKELGVTLDGICDTIILLWKEHLPKIRDFLIMSLIIIFLYEKYTVLKNLESFKFSQSKNAGTYFNI